MYKLFRGRTRIVVLAILVIVLGAAVYGFAAANTVSSSLAGEGAGNISGYWVTNIAYTLDSNDPAKFSTVEFGLYTDAGYSIFAPATSDVYAGIEDTSGPYWGAKCTTSGVPTWSCDISGISPNNVQAASQLHVAASD